MKRIINLYLFPVLLVASIQVNSQEVTLSEPVVVTDIEQLLELVKDGATLRSEEDKKRLDSLSLIHI